MAVFERRLDALCASGVGALEVKKYIKKHYEVWLSLQKQPVAVFERRLDALCASGVGALEVKEHIKKHYEVWLSLARAPGLGPGGRRFESCHLDYQ